MAGITTTSGDVVIPKNFKHDGTTYTIKSIGDRAFFNCTNLTSITIPDSVTTIGTFAFYNCSSLESIVIPDSVHTINDHAFISCISLKSVELS